MKHEHNDKAKKNNGMVSGSNKHGEQQPPEKIGIPARFLNWIARGAKNACPT